MQGQPREISTMNFMDMQAMPQGKKKYPEEYPWRVEAERVAVLPEGEFIPAEDLLDELEHVRKWPAEHWHLAFQGQLRTVSDADAELLRSRIQAAVPA